MSVVLYSRLSDQWSVENMCITLNFSGSLSKVKGTNNAV